MLRRVAIACPLTLEHSGQNETTSPNTVAALMFSRNSPESGSFHVFPDWLRHLAARQGDCADVGLRTVTTIGDAQTPSTIASVVYSGHQLAANLV